MSVRRLLLFAALSLPTAATPPASGADAVAFTEYSPLSRSSEMVRRLMSPLNARRVNEAAHGGALLSEQSTDLAHERFAVHVPTPAPSSGYGLLVFVSAWPDAIVPTAWTSVLDRHGMIFVSAGHSGNEASELDRRIPLALLGAYNIMKRYPVDPNRVYVGGFSGGALVAERVAVAYPDLFRGALQIAGSDPIGTDEIPLPPEALFRQFQQASRLVYLTGSRDVINLSKDAHSLQSMHDWCVFNVDTFVAPWSSHQLPDAASFGLALNALEKPASTRADELAACRARVESEMDAELQVASALAAEGKAAQARAKLIAVDARYGGLSAPSGSESGDVAKPPERQN